MLTKLLRILALIAILIVIILVTIAGIMILFGWETFPPQSIILPFERLAGI